MGQKIKLEERPSHQCRQESLIRLKVVGRRVGFLGSQALSFIYLTHQTALLWTLNSEN